MIILRLVQVLNLIGWEGVSSFLDQLHGEVKKTTAIIDYFRHSIEKYSTTCRMKL